MLEEGARGMDDSRTTVEVQKIVEVHHHHYYHKAHPIGKLLRPFIQEVDSDPKVQLKIHTYGFYYWTLNFPLIAAMFFFMPSAWAKWGLFITLMYSIYANWTSDYTGMSSSQSVINTTSVVSEKVTVDEQK